MAERARFGRAARLREWCADPLHPRRVRSAWAVLAALLVTGTASLVVPGHAGPTRVRTAASAPADLLTGSVAPPSTGQTPGPAPAPTPAPAARTGGPTPVAAPTPAPAPAFHPTHARADYMGATVAAHPNAFDGAGSPTLLQAGAPGIDVSNWQGYIDWPAVAAAGVRFAYIKATEATTYIDPQFAANYSGAVTAGLIRGAYHFAVPNASSGAAQADYFVDHGGTWTADGRTLPPALDIEYNPYGSNPCYGLTAGQMTGWVTDFATTVYNRTGRWPVIYTTTNWWSLCTTGSAAIAAHSPLWLASWAQAGEVRNRPPSWSSYAVWQNADRGPAPGDQDYFHGSYADLEVFAATSDRPAAGPTGPTGPTGPRSPVPPVAPPTRPPPVTSPTTPRLPVPVTQPHAATAVTLGPLLHS